jgi:cyclase
MCSRRDVKRVFSNGAPCRAVTIALGVALCGAIPILPAEPDDSGLDVVQLRPNFYLIAGAGANIGVQIGDNGVVLVDAGAKEASDQVIAALKGLTDRPIRYIIDTNADADHVGGNANVAQTGLSVFVNLVGAGQARIDTFKALTNGGTASILAHESVLKRMSAPTGQEPPFPVEAWPTEAYFEPRKYLRVNGEGIEVLRQPAAHSDADSFVFFRASDVVMAGDVLDKTRFPVIDIANGGSIQGEIDALNRLIDLAIPSVPFIYQGSGTYVVPGHGRVCEQQDVLDYRDMVVVVRDVIADMIEHGMTIEQIQAASPAKAYETQYGSDTGPWTTKMFVEAVYQSLTASK